jgi:glutaredoxin
MIMKLIRWPLGKLVLLIDRLTRPAWPQRAPALQQAVDASTRGMALYQFQACPFCVKTRRAMRRLGLNIETRDAQNDPRWRAQLEAEGGKLQVPCLYLPGTDDGDRWLYESNDIVALLERHLEQALQSAPTATAAANRAA